MLRTATLVVLGARNLSIGVGVGKRQSASAFSSLANLRANLEREADRATTGVRSDHRTDVADQDLA